MTKWYPRPMLSGTGESLRAGQIRLTQLGRTTPGREMLMGDQDIPGTSG